MNSAINNKAKKQQIAVFWLCSSDVSYLSLKTFEKYIYFDNSLYLKVSGVFVGGGENVIRARDLQGIDPDRIVSDLDQTPLRISVSEEDLGKEKLVLLKELFERHPGNTIVELEVTSKNGAKLLELNSVKIKKSLNLQQELHSLLSN